VGRFTARVTPERAVAPVRQLQQSALDAGLVSSNDGARIVAWNNVIIQSVHRADIAWVSAFDASLRKGLRSHPKGVVSLAFLHTGLRPAPKEVRNEVSRILRETDGQVHHVLCVEDVGLVAQLLVTVIRGVMVLSGKRVNYALPLSRAEAIAKTLPLVTGAARSGNLEPELAQAVAFCCSAA
jgi:hypothetical protein